MRAATVATSLILAATVGLIGATHAWARPAPTVGPIGATHALAGPAPPSTPSIAAPSPTGGATTALIVNPVEARSRPDGGRRIARVTMETAWSQEPQTLLVLGSRQGRSGQWLRVLLGIRPNGRKGWIPRADVLLSRTEIWITLDKRSKTLTIDRNGRRLRRFLAVIGKPATPTPDGLAAVYEHNRQGDPNGFLGPWVLPLTLFSNVLTNYGGGPGRIAIHGRSGASLADPLGSERSHGCIRVDNNEINWLASHAAQGTPVLIVG